MYYCGSCLHNYVIINDYILTTQPTLTKGFADWIHNS